ncbi:MAG: hypothetical protein WC528_04445 [Patescibacteria group bacterium]
MSSNKSLPVNKEEKKTRSGLRFLWFFLFTLFGGALIFAAFYMMARVYYGYYPPLGNDFYHSFNLSNYFKDNLTWPPGSWRYIWQYGGPTIIAYPWLNFYLVQPVIHFFGVFQGTMYYFLATLFLYGFFAYFLFYRLCKSYLVSIGLAVALLWSASTWRLLIAGSLTLTANQLFLILTLLLIFIYLQNKKLIYLLLSAMVAGISIISQSGSGSPFIVPLGFLIIWGTWGEKEGFWRASKIKHSLIYLLVAGLMASYYLYFTFINVLASRATREISDWITKEAFTSIITKTNPMILVLFVILLPVVIIGKKLKVSLRKIMPVIFAFLYLILFNLATVIGINPYSSSLPPPENWFILTLLIALAVAIFWGEAKEVIRSHSRQWLVGFITLAIFLLLLTPFGYWQSLNILQTYDKSNAVAGAPADAIHQAVVKGDFTALEKAIPDWVDKNNINERIFSSGLDLWWNAIYKTPLTGGYDQVLVNDINTNYINWTNELFNGSQLKRGLPAAIAKNSLLFHIDWLAIRNIEFVSGFSYYDDPDIVDLGHRLGDYQILGVNKNNFSPIIRPTNTPSLLVVADQEGYDTILRILAQENLNSRYIIPIKGPEYIDKLSDHDLMPFDAVLLYDYHYKKEKNFQKVPQEPWQKLAAYVKAGGKLFIEGGSDVKESDISNLPDGTLPEVFPVARTTRDQLGSEWQTEIKDNSLFSGIAVKDFGKLLYQDSPWKLSYADLNQVKDGAEVILTQKGEAVLAQQKLGQGEVIWSGLNLPYHIQSYNNLAESHLFNHLLGKLVILKEEELSPFDWQRPTAENIMIGAGNYKGVLFKEYFYPGWQAKQGQDDLKIYSAGFDFMYIPVRNQAPFSLHYKGDAKYWIMFIISLVTIFLILIYLVFGRGLSLACRKLFRLNKIKKKTTSWWEKDEE